MSTDSDELARTHQRIAELESLLREPERPKSRTPWFVYLAAVLCLVFGFVAAFAGKMEPKRFEHVVWTPTPEVMEEGSLVLATTQPPALLGSYAYVLGFRPGAGDACLVAFERKTWKEAWRSSSLPVEGQNRGRITITQSYVVFAGPGTVVVFDAKTGERLHTASLTDPPRRLFAYAADPDWVVMGNSLTHAEYDRAQAINVRTGVLREQAEGHGPLCPADATKTCIDIFEEPTKAVRAAIPGASSTYRVHGGADEFLLVHERAGLGPGMLEHALVLSESKVLWHAPLAPNRQWKPWPNTVPEGSVAVANGRILYRYVMPDGEERITARALANGDLLYDHAISGVGYGSQLGGFTAEGDDAFLVANDSLLVFDAKDGNIKKRFTTF